MNNLAIYSLLIDILKLTMAGIGTVWVAFYLVKPYLDKTERLRVLELKKAADTQTLPLRLQAYERIVLFIERSNPASLLVRLGAASFSATELYQLAANEVREEFQHNLTQQIYVSSRAWVVTRRLKDDTLNLLSSTLQGMPEGATGLDFSRTLLTHLSQLDDNPYDLATGLIHKDLEELFN